MSIKFRLVLSLVIGLLATTDGFSQAQVGEKNSGSFYSYYGVGFPVDLSSVQERSAGIFGVSLDNYQASTLQNPAIWGRNVLTTATSGFNISHYDASTTSSKSSNALVEASFLQLTLPIIKEQVGFSASLYPYTRSNYRIFDTGSAFPTPQDTVNYAIDNQGVGGINKLEFGIGYSPNRYLSVGYAPSYIFLSRTDTEYFFFGNSTTSSINLRDEITGSGFGHRFGLIANLPSIIGDNDRLTFGAAVTLPSSFEALEKTKSDKVVDGTEQEVQIGSTNKGNVKLPLEINTGFTYYPSSFINVSLEGQMQQWSEFEYELDAAQENVMSDRYRLGLGAQYHPYRYGSDKFLSKFKYSAGMSYDTGHLTINGQDIETLWLTTGIGIRSPRRSQSTIDVGFRYGFRGSSSNNLIQEDIWELNLSINLAEIMFFRRKLQ